MMSFVADYALGMVRESVEETAKAVASSVSENIDAAKAKLPKLPEEKPLRLAQARETREAAKLKYTRIRALDAAKAKLDNPAEQETFLHYARIFTWMQIKLCAELSYQQSCYFNHSKIAAVKRELETIQTLLTAKNWHSLCFLAKEGDANHILIQEILTKASSVALGPKQQKKVKDNAHAKEWNERLHEYMHLVQFIYAQKSHYFLFAKTVTEEQIRRMNQLEKILSTDTMDELVTLQASLLMPRP